MPTVVEEATLEEIFTEIGKLKNLSILVKLTCEEANDRLMAHKHSKVSCHGSVSLLLLKNLFLYFCKQELLLVP